MNTKEIDLSKAPEGATHYNTGLGPTWWKRDARGLTCWSGQLWTALLPVTTGPLNLVEIPPAPQWNGAGLPPVGTVCEMCDDEGAWHRSTVIANGVDRGVPTAIGQADDTLLWCQADHHCRPVHTPEQIAAEERDKARTEVLNAMVEAGATDEPQSLWEHRLKVVGEMLDMGFRKIDTSQPSHAEISSDIKQANLNRLAEKVLALNGERGGGMGGYSMGSSGVVARRHGCSSMTYPLVPVCERDLDELVALAKELKQ